MDHTLAQQTKTIDRYFLDELTPEERSAFEEHMFDCPDCAAKVKDDFAMLSDLKEVLREPQPAREAQKVTESGWRVWFRPLNFAPAFAALALACVVSYQNMVSIPGLLKPQVLETTPFVSTTRGGDAQVAMVKPGAAFFGASFDVANPAANVAVVCDFQAGNKEPLLSLDCGSHATSEFTLTLLLPAAKFPPGGYTMILRTASGTQAEIGRYAFAVRNESK